MTPSRPYLRVIMVIVVAGTLTNVAAILLNTVLCKKRDTVRRATLLQLQSALKSYHDARGTYPNTANLGWLGWLSSDPGDTGVPHDVDWIPGLAPTHIAHLPHDPLSASSRIPACAGGHIRQYEYRSDGKDYKLLSHCASESTPYDANDPLDDPQRPQWSWMVTNNPAVTSTW